MKDHHPKHPSEQKGEGLTDPVIIQVNEDIRQAFRKALRTLIDSRDQITDEVIGLYARWVRALEDENAKLKAEIEKLKGPAP
jgi:hypothetical protein